MQNNQRGLFLKHCVYVAKREFGLASSQAYQDVHARKRGLCSRTVSPSETQITVDVRAVETYKLQLNELRSEIN